MIVYNNSASNKREVAAYVDKPSVKIMPPIAANDNDRWLNEKQTAELLNVSVKWLQKMRYTGGGIPFYKFGDKMVRYKMSEIFLYCEKNSHQNTSQ